MTQELVGPPAAKRRRLSVHIVSKSKKGAGNKKEKLDTSPTSVLEVSYKLSYYGGLESAIYTIWF